MNEKTGHPTAGNPQEHTTEDSQQRLRGEDRRGYDRQPLVGLPTSYEARYALSGGPAEAQVEQAKIAYYRPGQGKQSKPGRSQSAHYQGQARQRYRQRQQVAGQVVPSAAD